MRSMRAIGLFLFVVTAALYVPVIDHEFVNYDDPDFVYRNAQVAGGLTWEGVRWASTAIVASNWHPVTMLSHMLDSSLFGLDPAGHHLTSVLLHALNTVLLFLLLRRTTDSVWPSALVAALFAWHPLHVESVAWVAERKDVLSTCFGLLALLAYAAYVLNRSWRAFGLALLCYALSLMSKPMLVTLPFLLLLLDFWPLARLPGPFLTGSSSGSASTTAPSPSVRPVWWRLIVEKVPFAALSISSCLVTLWTQRHAGSVVSLEVVPFRERLLNVVTAYADYLYKTFWPKDLCVLYPLPYKWPWHDAVRDALLLAGITVLALSHLRRRPWLAVGWCWFLGTLVPVIGLIQVGSQLMADRYTYLPLIGVFLMLSWSVREWLEGHPRWLRPLTVTIAGLLVTSAGLSRLQLVHWRNSITLFERAIAVTRNNHIAYGNLGARLLETGQIERSIVCLQEAVRLDPRFVPFRINLGVALTEAGRIAESQPQFEAALRLNPDSLEANYFLGVALASLERYAEAKPLLLRAIALAPGNLYYRRGVALIMAKQNDLEPAIEQFSEVVRRNPNDDSAVYNLGTLFARQGRHGAAIIMLDKALRLNPNSIETLRSLAWIFATADNARHRNGAMAVQCAERALSLSGGTDAYTLDTLAAAYAEAGRFPEAVATARKALELAGQRSQQKLAVELQNRLQTYESKQPYRQAKPAP